MPAQSSPVEQALPLQDPAKLHLLLQLSRTAAPLLAHLQLLHAGIASVKEALHCVNPSVTSRALVRWQGEGSAWLLHTVAADAAVQFVALA